MSNTNGWGRRERDAEELRRWLCQRLAAILEIDAGGIDPLERFTRYGLSSAQALELIGELQERVGAELPATLFWDHPTLTAVVEHLARGADPSEQPPAKGRPTTEAGSDEPIAVIGLGCRFPGASSPLELWRLLAEGRDQITEVPPSRWDLRAFYSDDPSAPGKMSTRFGGFLDDVAGFDATFFGISPREAVDMDPQQRLMLEVAWEALEDAGIAPPHLKGSKTGVYLGVIWGDYATLHHRAGVRNISPYTATGSHASIVPNRVSYFLGAQGPSMAVDSACSSSLVAVHLACQSLRSGECNLAIAGGVNLILAPDSTIAMSKFGAMAPDGRCKTFDAGANGYVRGEGAGAIVLKRLSQAVMDMDDIYCVIRGSAVNNDGFSNGLTAPNPQAQEEVLREAYRRAGVSPWQVQYVEAHGTGTLLGDPIEAKSIGAVLGRKRRTDRACAIGSIKTNLGHLEAAAGIAGLLKVALAIRQRQLPASLHFKTPNPHIPFGDLRLKVQSALGPWPVPSEPLTAGVSSFGFGGTNAHVVVQELRREPAQLITLAAPSAESLRTQAKRVSERLGAQDPPLGSVWPTTGDAGPPTAHRAAFTATTVARARELLAGIESGKPDPLVAVATPVAAPRLVFVFPGQGAQWPGMGNSLLRSEPVFRAALHSCDALIKQEAGFSPLELIATRAPLSDDAAVIQPLTFALQVAQAAMWRSWGVEPSLVIGHSMGEVAAAHVAGILSLEDATHVICARSRLVHERAAGAGGMAVVELPAAQTAERLQAFPGLSIAAFNGPTTTVVAGVKDQLLQLLAQCEREEAFAQLVRVDYASHCAQMEPLEPELLQLLRTIRPCRAKIPLLSTVTLAQVEGYELGPGYWAKNLKEPVRFHQAVSAAAQRGLHHFVELSGHPITTLAIERTLQAGRWPGRALPTFRREEDERGAMLGSLGQLYCAGVEARWSRVAGDPEGDACIFTLSARHAESLRELSRRLQELVRGPASAADLVDLAYTSSLHRAHHEQRASFVCRSRDELLSHLEALAKSEPRPGLVTGRRPMAGAPQLAFYFGGGTADATGHELYRREPVFQRSVDACDESFRRLGEPSVAQRLSGAAASDAPVAFTLQVALSELLRSWGIVPAAVMGDGLGEIAAAHVSGVLGLDDAARIVSKARRAPNGVGTPASLLEALSGVQPGLARLPFYSSSLSRRCTGPELDAAYWRDVLTHPSQPRRALGGVIDAGFTHFLELSAYGALEAQLAQLKGRDDAPRWAIAALRPDEGGERVALLKALAELYVAGVDPLWANVHPKSARRTAFPLVAWRRERIWPSGEALLPPEGHRPRSKAHPLLGAHAMVMGEGPDDLVHVWESELDAQTLPELLDHVVQSETAVPGVAMLQLALAAGRELCGRPVGLKDVEFRRALLLPPSGSLQLQVSVRNEAGRRVFRICTRDTDWTLHATGTVVEPGPPAVARSTADTQALAPLDPKAYYAWLAAQGLVLGPAFQRVERLSSANGEVSATVRAAPQAVETECWVLDALLQPAFAAPERRLFEQHPGDTFVPVQVESVEIFRPSQGSLTSRVRLRQANPAYFEIDLQVSDEAGEAVLRAERIRFARLGAKAEGRAEVSQLEYRLAWQAGAPSADRGRATASGAWLVIGAAPARAVALGLEALGGDVSKLPVSALTETRKVVEAWASSAKSRGRGVVICFERTPDSAGRELPWCRQLVELVQTLAASKPEPAAKLWVLTRGAQAVEPRERPDASLATLWGLGRTVEVEHPEVWGGLLDLDPAADPDPAQLASELSGAPSDTQIAFRNGTRYVLRVRQAQPAPSAAFACRADGTYLITGGLGALGLEVARWLVSRGARRLILLSRRKLPERAAWAQAGPTVAPTLERLKALEAAGATVLTAAADVADAEAMGALWAEWGRLLPPLRGIVHAAGIIEPTLLAAMEPDHLSRLLSAKVCGTRVLDSLSRSTPLDFFALFSSFEAILPMRGQAAYAAGSAFLDAFAVAARAQGRAVTSIDWGRWGDAGLASTEQASAYLQAHGVKALSPQQSLEALGRALYGDEAQRMVLWADWAKLLETEAPGTARLLEDVARPAPSARPAAPLGLGSETDAVKRKQLILETVSALIAQVLRQGVDAIEPHRPLNALGLESIMAAELRHRVEETFGVRVSLLSLLRGETAAKLTERIASGLAKGAPPLSKATVGSAPPLESAPSTAATGVQPTLETAAPADRFEPFALTDIQHAYWVGRQGIFEWGNIGTHFYLEADGALDPVRLERAWQKMLARHDMLRALILPFGDQQVQEQVPPTAITVQDLTTCSSEERGAALAATRERLSSSVPALDAWPHYQIVLSLLPSGATRLSLNIDMLVIDAFSLRIIFRDWGALYASDSELAPLTLTFREYQRLEASLGASDAGKRSEAYWARRMHDLPPAPQLPRSAIPLSDLKRPRVVHHLGELGAQHWGALKRRAQEAGLTPSGLLCSAFAEVLARWSARKAFTINLTQFRRFPVHSEVNEIVGDFTSTVLLGIDWSGEGSFVERATKLTEQLWTDMEHSHVSGVRVLRELSKSRRELHFMPVVFTSALGDLQPGMAWAGNLGYVATETSQVCLDNRVQEFGGKLVFGWDVAEGYFAQGVVEPMFEEYVGMLQRLADGDPEAWGHRTRAQQVEAGWRRLAEINATDWEVPAGLLHQGAQRRAATQPEHPAIVAPDRTLTYAELLSRARRVGRRLREMGAQKNTLVAVVTPAGWERVVAALGVLESGAAYLPVDPELPQERISYLLENGQVKLAVTCGWVEDTIDWPEHLQRLRVDDPALHQVSDEPLAPVQEPTDLAYVIYTSGSTGHPKGVMIDHRGALNTCLDVNQRFGVKPSDRVLALSNLSFDLSVYDLFGVLAAGATIVFPGADAKRDPAQWARTLLREKVTLWNTVPALLGMLVEYEEARRTGALASLRLALLSGDWIPLDLPDRTRALAPELKVISLGGATEASIWSVLYPIERIDPSWKSIPYGTAMRAQRLYVLDEALEPTPTWVQGQIFIAGVGLAKGYWRDPEKTERSFIAHPATGERLYRTGDFGRLLPDGNIEFLGRVDSQIKIRGHRIEIGEIEASLRQHPAVAECYVLVRDWRKGATRSGPTGRAVSQHRFLVAYAVPRPGAQLNEEALRELLKQRLPEYMVPSRIIPLENVPLSPNGKVDRRALPDADEMPVAGDAFQAPQTPLQRTLVEIWAEVLSLPPERISVKDTFTELGGNSLLLVKAAGLISERLRVELKIPDLFEHPVVEQLAALIERTQANGAQEGPQVVARAQRRKQLMERLKASRGGSLT
jgi:amino acid adenylation domain-containing protein